MTFHVATTLDDLWAGEMRGAVVGGYRVLLVHVEGQVRAFEDRCAHQGVPLSEGTLEGHEIVCRAHQWRYDARNGRGVNPASVCLRELPVRIEGTCILVETSGAGRPPTWTGRNEGDP